FFFLLYADHRDLHSFPTRRSSDLHHDHRFVAARTVQLMRGRHGVIVTGFCRRRIRQMTVRSWMTDARLLHVTDDGCDAGTVIQRSEEHTSELQSRGHLVCRLLLEK